MNVGLARATLRNVPADEWSLDEKSYLDGEFVPTVCCTDPRITLELCEAAGLVSARGKGLLFALEASWENPQRIYISGTENLTFLANIGAKFPWADEFKTTTLTHG